VKTREFLIDLEDAPARPGAPRPDPEEVARRRELDHRKLRRMVSYADTARCLRATILHYFGDAAAREPCGACGNCARLRALDEPDRLRVRKILSGVARAGERFGRRKIAAMLTGRLDELPESLTHLSTTGILQEDSPAIVERWIAAACGAGLLRASDDQYRVLGLTPLGRDVMSGRVEEVRVAVPEAPARAGRRAKRTRGGRAARGGQPGETTDAAPPLAPVVEALRAWRLEEARRRAVAPFVVLHDRTLMAIASRLPRSHEELGELPGIGPGKLAAYGETILGIVAGAAGDTAATD
jgi:ATP-dependent DNA helicase RecQ